MKAKRLVSALTMIALLAGIFTGCSGDGGTTSSTGGDSSTAGDSSAAESTGGDTEKFNTTLNVIGVDNVIATTAFDEEHLQELRDLYGIEVNFQQFTNEQASNKIAVSMAAGGADIDALMFRPLDETLLFVQNGWLENLQPYIDADPEAANYDDYMDASKEVTQDPATGDAVGLPVMTESGAVYYNKTMWEAAGLTEDDYPKTMDELYDVAVKLTDRDAGVSGFACRGMANPAVTQFSGFLRAYGADFFTEADDGTKTATINTPEAVEAFEFYGKLLRDTGPDGVLSMTWTETWSLFTQGQTAMRFDANTNLGSWDPDNSAITLEEIGCFDLPVGPDGDYGNYSITPWALGISYGSTQKDAAWALINWMASSEMQQDAQSNGSSAARTSVWEVEGLSSWPQEFQDLAAAVGNKAHGTDRPYMINVASARDVIGQVIVTAIEGGDVQAAADTANADFQKLLDEEK